ncbi:MAG TPA: thioredoxin domain-containing protein [Nitrospirales bacterium]|nr:thioredoxin domain-containing protein [Nitrospirales bacterium]
MKHEYTNRLIDETSPYLLQHAHNPVDWYPWGAEALDRAKTENTPILLSIGYSACHWCHVMERESFENPATATLMNDNFINIKVDREERPDLDDIYQKAVQAFIGRGGGWPLTAFLTPEQEPFYGGTYFPPVPRYKMPAFPDLLVGIAEAYRDKQSDVRQNIQQVMAGLRRIGAPQPSDAPLDTALVDDAVKGFSGFYEPVDGGFGAGPKFPTAQPFQLALRHYQRTRTESSRDMTLHSIRKIAAGGVYDHLGGGFHRYSVDSKWLVPHFEKMLYDNAQLIRLYLDGWRLTQTFRFRQVVEETLEYVRREMISPEGGFYTAQDADSEGVEGKFFVWTPEEVNAILGPELGAEMCRIYDVTESGNFEGKAILNRIASSDFDEKEMDRIEVLLNPARKQLLAAREPRIKPQRDDKILTGWNGLMISGALDAYQTLGNPSYLVMAENALDFLFTAAYKNGHLYRTVTNGQGKLNGYLDDYAFLAAALLDAYESTFNDKYLEGARELTAVMVERFWDSRAGGCFFTANNHETLIQRMKSGSDGPIPSGNAVAAMNFLRLFSLTGEQTYHDRAEQTFKLFRSEMDNNGYGSAAMLNALDFYLERPKEIVIVGDRTDPSTKDLLTRIHSTYIPNKVLILVDENSALSLPPIAQGKSSLDGKPTVYVCHNFTCSRPVTTWEDLEPLL